MTAAFRVLGVLLAIYVVHSVMRGAVYAKSGVWGEQLRRDDDAPRYWSAIVVYALLSLALIFVF